MTRVSDRETRRSAAGIAGKAVAALLWILGLACVAPVIAALAGCFWHEGAPSTAHFAAAFADIAGTARLLLNSGVVTLGAVLVALVLGVPMGFLCFRTDLPFRRVIIVGALVAACVPVYVTATCWMALFGMRFWLYSPCGAAWIHGLACTPLVVLITGACFATVDRSQEEAAALHTGAAGIFRHVSLPHAAWSMAAAAMVVAVLCLADITVTDVLVVRTFAEEVFTQFQLGAGPERAAAVSFPVVFLLAALAAALRRKLRDYGEAAVYGTGPAPAPLPLGAKRLPIALAVGCIVAAFLVVPVGSLLRTVGSCESLLTSFRASDRELLGTLRVTPIAASVCVVLAAGAARAAVKSRMARWPITVLAVLLVAVPAPIVGIGLIKVLNRPGPLGAIYDSQAVLVAAYVIRTLPFAFLVILPAVKRIPRELDDQLALAGGGLFHKVTCVLAPFCWKAIAVAWLLAFVLSLAETGASFLVVPPGRTTLTIRFLTLIHYGVYPDAAGICLLLLAVVAVAALGIGGLLWPAMKDRFA